MSRQIVIGAGGVGSFLLPKLCRLEKEILIVDGDTLEEKNLDRQLFSRDKIGSNKASALAEIYGLSGASIPEYFTSGLMELKRDDLLWCCADNHACRREVLEACDLYRCKAILCANEYVDFEAIFYEVSMRDTPNDPRVFYPNILTDRSGDPLGPPGCVEASKTNRQLVIANSAASEFGMWLYWFWFHEAAQMPPDTKEFWPVHHRGNSMMMRTIRFGDRLKEPQGDQT